MCVSTFIEYLDKYITRSISSDKSSLHYHAHCATIHPTIQHSFNFHSAHVTRAIQDRYNIIKRTKEQKKRKPISCLLVMYQLAWFSLLSVSRGFVFLLPEGFASSKCYLPKKFHCSRGHFWVVARFHPVTEPVSIFNHFPSKILFIQHFQSVEVQHAP